jgi:endonuclease G
LNDALLGTLSTDRKIGLKSVRIQNVGSVQMQFNATSSSSVSVSHAVYGTDGASSWGLWYSTNSGTSWIQVGSAITTSSTTLQTATFNIAYNGAIRFKIVKSSGGTYRLNFDNFVINAYETTAPPPVTTATRDDNMGMGNPSGAVASTTYTTNYLMVKNMYTLSYNSVRGTPNWVSWHLSTAWTGTAPRATTFTTDATLPTTWYHVTTSNYTNSGFDRGHMCPSADRNFTTTENKVTFMMTNIVPQAPINNQQTWAFLEDYCRTLSDAGNELYITSGVYGTGGTGSVGTFSTIASGKVTVPAGVWKVIVVLPNGTNDVARVLSTTRVIAVYIPNVQTVSTTWTNYRCTVDYIENLTGYNFLSNVPTTIQTIIEAKTDNVAI